MAGFKPVFSGDEHTIQAIQRAAAGFHAVAEGHFDDEEHPFLVLTGPVFEDLVKVARIIATILAPHDGYRDLWRPVMLVKPPKMAGVAYHIFPTPGLGFRPVVSVDEVAEQSSKDKMPEVALPKESRLHYIQSVEKKVRDLLTNFSTVANALSMRVHFGKLFLRSWKGKSTCDFNELQTRLMRSGLLATTVFDPT
jgi:hypothetical protein